MSLSTLIERERISIPGPSHADHVRWNNSVIVSDLAIDPNFVSVTRSDVRTYRAAYMGRFWLASRDLARRILSFDPDQEEKGLYLYSKSGLGKTSIMKCLALRLQQNFPGEVKYLQLSDALSAMTRDQFAFQTEVIRTLVNTRFLFIDDLGIERSTDWSRERIYSVFDKRMHAFSPEGRRKFTFCSSNLSLLELGKKYHRRDIRRIEDSCEIIELKKVKDK